MIPLPSAISGGLTWSKLPRSRNYELRKNGDVVGTPRASQLLVIEVPRRDGRWPLELSAQGLLRR
jgi:hypothetical protein